MPPGADTGVFSTGLRGRPGPHSACGPELHQSRPHEVSMARALPGRGTWHQSPAPGSPGICTSTSPPRGLVRPEVGGPPYPPGLLFLSGRMAGSVPVKSGEPLATMPSPWGLVHIAQVKEPGGGQWCLDWSVVLSSWTPSRLDPVPPQNRIPVEPATLTGSCPEVPCWECWALLLQLFGQHPSPCPPASTCQLTPRRLCQNLLLEMPLGWCTPGSVVSHPVRANTPRTGLPDDCTHPPPDPVKFMLRKP